MGTIPVHLTPQMSCFVLLCTIPVDLELANNKFTGGISVLGALSNLETLDLSNNAFSGTIPDMFDQLFRLHELVLANNKFEGSIPHTIPHLQTLSKSFKHEPI